MEWRDVFQFEMACQVLDEAGIPYERVSHGGNWVEDPACGSVTAPVYLRVRDTDFELARTLLAQTVGRGVVPDGR